MNPIAPSSSARQAITRAEPIDRAPERDGDAHETTSRGVSKQAEFSVLLALLAGTGARVRNDILRQLPAEGASLVDKLLAEAGAGATEEAGAGEAELSASDSMGGLMLGRDQQESAADAMRYGQLVRNEMGLQTPGHDRGGRMPGTSSRGTEIVGDVTDASSAKGTNGLPGLARALQHSQATDTLSRIVSRRGASVEQLLALRDEKGADARAALDGILSQAGTATGEQLAAFANDSTMPPAAAVAAAALAAAHAKSRANPDTPVRDADALVPEFRTRIDRVIARMKQEYGHDVSLVETARSQERQDALFEQGRTRPGNIVTWTRDSAHTRGEAADMLVDGTYNNAEGFARLQRIAREEGLRTLGVKDPGHLELPRNARQADAMLGGAAKISARIEHANMQSSNAASPAVAPVAAVASVAGVARVADSSAPAAPAAPAATGNASMYSALGGAAGKSDTGNASNGNAFGKGERDESGTPLNNGRKLGQRRVESDDSGHGHAFGQVAGPASASSVAKADGAAPVAGTDSAQRVADLQDRRDATPGSVSRLTLSVDGVNGDSDRITIDLRGKSVGTHIETNAANADALRSRTGELQEALGRHGLDGDTVRISSSARAEGTDGARGAGTGADRDALKLAAAQQGSANDGAAGNGQQRSTAREWDKQDDARRARDEQRDAKHDAKHDAKQDAKRDGRERGQQRFFNEGQR